MSKLLSDNTVVKIKDEFAENYKKSYRGYLQVLGANMHEVIVTPMKGVSSDSRFRVRPEEVEEIKLQGYKVKTWGSNFEINAYGKSFYQPTLKLLETKLQNFIKNMQQLELKKGQKMIVWRPDYSGSDYHKAIRIAVIEIKSVGKMTYTLENGLQMAKFTYDNKLYTGTLYPQHRYNFKAKHIKCDIFGDTFPVAYATKYSKKTYDEIAGYVQKVYDKKMVQKNRQDDLEETRKPYADYKNKLQMELTYKLRDKYIEVLCSSCKHYKENGHCAHDDEFFKAGKLSEATSMFWGHSNMCYWERK